MEIVVGTHQTFHLGSGSFVDQTKDGENHREAKEDEPQATDGSNDVVAKELGVVQLGGLEEMVELRLLGAAEGELDLLL